MREIHQPFRQSATLTDGPLVSVIVIPEAGSDLESARACIDAQNYTRIETIISNGGPPGDWSGYQTAYEKASGSVVAWIHALL